MRKYIFLIIAFLALTGCEKDKSASFVDGEEVYVHLSLEANTPISFNIEDNGASVKSVYDPDGTTETAELIKNLWIIQYNGTSDNATLLGEPNYIENFSAFISQPDKQVKLVSTSNPSTIFFIANTFEGKNQFTIAQGSTIADLKSRTKLVDGEESILGNGSGTYHPIFYTTVIADEIKEGSEINGTLKRNVAKVSVKLTNNTPVSERVTISTVQLCSIPHASYYIPDNSSETFPSAGNNTINYSSIDWTTNSVPLEFTTYLPVNKRGRIENTAPAAKNINPPQGATYLVLKGSYMENGEEIPISYTFYLGKDMVQDFNIEANHAYSFNIAINAKGDWMTDSRIEEWKTVDFTSSKYPLANSYILNPIEWGTAKRTFRIPVQRAMTFWGKDGKADYENDEYLSFRQNGGKWIAFVLASDFEIDETNFCITKNKGNKDTDPYFEVKVAPGTKGNVIVAVGPDDDTQNISWSWHLWITDYDPYDALDWGDGTSGQYIYPVRNGAVHRYEGTYWNTYRNLYIMDRNLGFMSENLYPEDNIGLLYYQFGRKDPFFFSSDIYKNKSAKHPRNSVVFSVANTEEINGVAYSVMHPLSYIKPNSGTEREYTGWTYGNKYNPTDYDSKIIWQDPYTSKWNNNATDKSIFDPCPPGYRVPDKRIWADFREISDARPTTNAYPANRFDNGYVLKESDYKYGFKPFNAIKGLQYWPFMGENMLIPDKPVYIPAAGYFHPGDGLKASSHGNLFTDNKINGSYEKWNFLWSGNSENEDQGMGYTSQQDYLIVNFPRTRARAFPVRCITDKK